VHEWWQRFRSGAAGNHILVNNAGMAQAASSGNTTVEKSAMQIGNDSCETAHTAFLMTRGVALPIMRSRIRQNRQW